MSWDPSCSQASLPRQSTQSQSCSAPTGRILPQLGHTSHTHRAVISYQLRHPRRFQVCHSLLKEAFLCLLLCFIESQKGLCEKGP